MRYALRPARDADRDWAYALKRDAYREVVERQFGGWDEVWQREFFARRWAPAISQVVSVNGSDVALIAVDRRDDCIWIDEIQVIRAWRGRGLGSRVLHDLIADADGKPVGLQVLKQNARAKTLYERLGFTTTGETDTHYVMRREADC